jgi:hypothetical protein
LPARADRSSDRSEDERARTALVLERPVDGGEQERVRDRDGGLHPQSPHRLPGREGPGRGTGRCPEIGKVPPAEEEVRREVREVELQEQDSGLDPRLRKEERRKRDERRKEALREMERSDRSRRNPRVPEKTAREIAISDERRLSRRRGIGEERVFGLKQSLLRSPPRVVGADELVRRENPPPEEKRREEDEVEDEEGRDAEASGLRGVQRDGGETIASSR